MDYVLNKNGKVLLSLKSEHPKKESTTISIPEGVEEIIYDVFQEYKGRITKIILPSTFKGAAFYSRSRAPITYLFEKVDIQAIEVSENNSRYKTFGGVLYNKSMTKLYYYPSAKASRIFELPKTVKSVEGFAVNHTILQRVLLPKSLKQIKFCAFAANMQLREVVVPSSCKVIESYAFESCFRLDKQRVLQKCSIEVDEKSIFDFPALEQVKIDKAPVEKTEIYKARNAIEAEKIYKMHKNNCSSLSEKIMAIAKDNGYDGFVLPMMPVLALSIFGTNFEAGCKRYAAAVKFLLAYNNLVDKIANSDLSLEEIPNKVTSNFKPRIYTRFYRNYTTDSWNDDGGRYIVFKTEEKKNRCTFSSEEQARLYYPSGDYEPYKINRVIIADIGENDFDACWELLYKEIRFNRHKYYDFFVTKENRAKKLIGDICTIPYEKGMKIEYGDIVLVVYQQYGRTYWRFNIPTYKEFLQ